MKSIESNFKQMISPIWVDPTIQVNPKSLIFNDDDIGDVDILTTLW